MSFPKQIVIAVVVCVGVGLYPLVAYANGQTQAAAAAGMALSVLHALMGYATVEYSLKKSHGVFVQIVLGGIVVRLFVMVGVLMILILVLHMHVIALVGTMFVTYIVFLVLEIVHIQHRLNKEHPLSNQI